MDKQATSLRTHDCGALRLRDAGRFVTLCGWVQAIRDKGGLVWIDVRDRYGVTQVQVSRGTMPLLVDRVRRLTLESVVQVKGKVVERTAKNSAIPTGDVEVVPTEMVVLSKAGLLPFDLQKRTEREGLRMAHRYLDLRRRVLQENLLLRHRVVEAIRGFLNGHGFLEVETPLLVKSTPEGASDFVVPTRYENEYYALPQSPQLLKQVLMVGGVDRYYQLAKCLRDEDLRENRQPEFTQVDVEASFVTGRDVMDLCEKMVQYVWQRVMGVDLPRFPRITYEAAMERYGTDKPDLRWDMPFINITKEAKGTGVAMFEAAGTVLAMCVRGGARYSRKMLEGVQCLVKERHPSIPYLVYVKWPQGGQARASVHGLEEERVSKWLARSGAKAGDLLLVVGGAKLSAIAALREVRGEVIKVGSIPPQKSYAPLWVTDFPLFEKGGDGQLRAVHHPFTAPRASDVALLDGSPESVVSQAYDLVINGEEVGSGSIRIHDASLQQKVLRQLGLDDARIKERFGFLLRAFSYGAPPHGGMALGLARLCCLLGGRSSAIRDYIAFPKNNQGRDTMMGAPSRLEKRGEAA